MAKKKKEKKESGLPIVIALVFFVLTTVGLGVFCYVLYADQEGKDVAVAKSVDDIKGANKVAKEAELKARLYRLVIGIEEPDDRTTLIGESKPGDLYVAELKKVNEAIDKRLASVAQADKTVPQMTSKDVLGWAPDNANALPASGPTKFIIDEAAKAIGHRELAKTAADGDKKNYEDAAAALKLKSDAFDNAVAELNKTRTAIANDIKAKLDQMQKASTDKQAGFAAEIKRLMEEGDKKLDELTKSKTEVKLAADEISRLKTDLAGLQEAKKKGEQFFDEPLGRILRRNPDDTVDIDIGSNDKAKPGLTFTVLPADFPIKGYQSRVRVFRTPDDRGVFREVTRFVEKATIEIVEVLGPTSSKARIVSEHDAIRDRILPGDLIYNVAWRRGYVDHVALYGIFDINGDGSDDIKNIVRDFDRMGIPVDAYYDLKEKKWVGDLSSKTRYLIGGDMPSPRPNDPFLEAKSKLNSALAGARDEAKNKGITVISFRDIFPRMGYRAKLDVGEDKIHQATSQYLDAVPNAPAAPAPGN